MTRTVEEALREKIDAFAVACARQAITPEGAVEIGATRRTLEAAIRALASPPPAERGMASGECGSCGQTVPLWLGDHQHPEGWPCFGSGCLPSSAPARDDRGEEPDPDLVRWLVAGEWPRELSPVEVLDRAVALARETAARPAASSSGEATALRELAQRFSDPSLRDAALLGVLNGEAFTRGRKAGIGAAARAVEEQMVSHGADAASIIRRLALPSPAQATTPAGCGCGEGGLCERHRIEGHCCGEYGAYCDSDVHAAPASPQATTPAPSHDAKE
jgi:hypothetical protein